MVDDVPLCLINLVGATVRHETVERPSDVGIGRCCFICSLRALRVAEHGAHAACVGVDDVADAIGTSLWVWPDDAVSHELTR